MKTFYAKNRQEWRAWLKKNYKTEKEIWLLNPHTASGKKRIPYNDTVEEALCFGWIDSTVRNVNKNFSAQRFTPRKPKSNYSQANIERLKLLGRQGMLVPEVKKATAGIIKQKFVFPPDIISKIKKDRAAWAGFLEYPDVYKRLRVAYVDGARKRPDEFKKRLANLIKTSETGSMVGYGGIEKYYKKRKEK